ncbi:hypothetical protein DKL61_05365 [Gammaproteobacteria bacterium ESL0073]|nr:hypothetical protein DKL61_05365 [Gammaproteobacteria bacterium ESL0073]
MSKKGYFWLPILSGTLSATILFVLLLYYDWLNILTCLLIPFFSGFICLSFANKIIQQDKLCNICLPWAALVLLVPFSYWKVKLLIIAMFPLASFGGLLASYFFLRNKNKDD